MPKWIDGHVNFNPDKEIPSLEGKVIFVTGGTAGIGSETIKAFVKHSPAHIYFSGRNTEAANALIQEAKKINASVGLTFISMDMSSLASVKSATEKFVHDRLDILICNGGVMALPPSLSKDGYEVQFAINHVAHAMLIKQLLPTLLKTAELPGADVRITFVISLAWQGHPAGGVRFASLTTPQDGFFGPFVRYGQSKFASLVYASELARRYPQIMSNSVHPGVVETGMTRSLSFKNRTIIRILNFLQGITPLPLEKGCYSQIWVAAGAKRSELVNGGFYTPIGVQSNNLFDADAKSEKVADELWKWTNEALAKF